jgi:hypothetical protein
MSISDLMHMESLFKAHKLDRSRISTPKLEDRTELASRFLVRAR